jgi:DNA-binding LytR/AlgR family response regulator
MTSDAAANAPPRLRAVIVDDEPLSRRAMRQLLDARPDVEIVGELESVTQLDALPERADVLFLDIEMPVQSGLDLARRLSSSGGQPHVVFVTAHDEYAVPAFDVSAVDYLTKPVAPARLERAIARVHERVAAARALTERRAEPEPPPPTSIVTRVGTRDVVIPVADITLLEADGVYTVVHLSGRRHLVRRSLDDLEQMLGRAQFLRVHRSYLVRRSAILEARPSAAAPLRELVLVGGMVVPVSRRRQAALARELRS